MKHRNMAVGALLALGASCSANNTEVPLDAGVDAAVDVATCDAGFERVDGGQCALPAGPAVKPQAGELLIAEVYFSGAAPAGGTDHYFSDQFIELVNTTDQPLDLSGILIGDAYGAAGEINPGMMPDSFAAARPDDVVLSSVWRIPDGARLEAGAQLVIAHDGTNHRPFSTIDLSGAAFETFVAGSGNDDDHPTVANLEEVVFNGGYDWLVPVFGASIVVLEADTPLGTETGAFADLATAPVSAVLDGVDALMDASSADFKRLPASVDAGFASVSGTYVGESLHRRQTDGVFQDTNDSGADFEVGPPEPSRARSPDGVFGDPWIELGTGAGAFEPLTDGGNIELVSGIQGGWHLDAGIRFGGFGPDGVLLVYDAVDADAQRISLVTQAELFEESLIEEADGWSRVGDRVVLDVSDPTTILGTTVVLRVTAELGGQTWSDERSVTIVDVE